MGFLVAIVPGSCMAALSPAWVQAVDDVLAVKDLLSLSIEKLSNFEKSLRFR